MKLNSVWNAWSKFWFDLDSPLPMAGFRICVGLLLFQVLLCQVGSDYMNWYGPKGIISIGAIQTNWWLNGPRFDLLLCLPRTELSAQLFWWAYFISLICFTIGYKTRYACIAVCLINISLQNHQPFSLNGGDAILRIYTVYLMFSECGAAWSVDSLIKRFHNPEVFEKPIQVPVLGARLVQLQLCISYWSTICYKIIGPQWLDGTAVYYATRLEDIVRYNLPFKLFDNLSVLKFLTWATLLIETAMFTCVWIIELRYFVLAAAFSLHLGIDYAINLPVFEWAFVAGYISFVRGEDLEKVLGFVKTHLARKLGPQFRLQYSIDIPNSYATARLVEGLDVFGRFELEPVHADCLHGLIAICSGDAEKSVQKTTLKTLTTNLPLLWIIYPLLAMHKESYAGSSHESAHV